MAAPAEDPTPPNKVPTITEMFLTLGSTFVDSSMIATIPELGHLAPIILTVGPFILGAISLNYPLLMLSLSSLEAGAIYTLISKATSYGATPSSISSSEKGPRCSSYFQTLTSSRFRFLVGEGIKGAFPNYPLYFISFMAVYCVESMNYFSKECSALGSQYSNRPYLGVLSATMLIILYALYLLVYGCDSLLNLACSAALGGLIGYLICYQNANLFGKSSVDLLFIPSIVKRSGMDYICVSSSS